MIMSIDKLSVICIIFAEFLLILGAGASVIEKLEASLCYRSGFLKALESLCDFL